MSDSIVHRGPDDGDLFYDEQLGLGLAHRRLSIVGIDERGREPIWNEDHSIALVFNGEIYNYRELQAQLKHHRFSSEMDGEVLLHLYEDFGTSFLNSLNGIFAFVIWDGRKQLLWGARDHLGIKPLYYAQTKEAFLFASEMKALLASSAEVLPRELNVDAIGAHLQYVWCPAPTTMLKDVHLLRPGSFFTLHGQRFEEHSWWRLPLPFPTESGRSLGSWGEELWDVFKRSVQRQLMAEVPLGAFLSGGIDSTAVVAAMRELNPGEDVACYSMRISGPRSLDSFSDDFGYAQRAARWLDVDLREVVGHPGMVEELDDVLWHLEAPIADSAPFFLRAICRQAKGDGIKVLLSGAGGDDLFSGYRRHQALHFMARLGPVPAALLRRVIGAIVPWGNATGVMRRLRKLHTLLGRSPTEAVRASFEWTPREIVEQLVPHLAEGERIEPLRESLEAVSQEPSMLHRQLFLEAQHFLADHNLLYTDKLSMAEGVEVRVPFLDREMISFALRVPAEMKLSLFSTKRVLREAVSSRIPPEILRRSKAGFGGPVRDWLVGPLRPMVEDLMGRGTSGVFDGKVLRSLWSQTLSGRADFVYLLLGVLMVERWRTLFLDPSLSSHTRSSMRRVG